MGRARVHQGGFTLIEILVVVAIIALLGAIAVPQLLGAREKAKHGACLGAMHVLDPELMNTMEGYEANGLEDAADETIVTVIERLESAQTVSNPRNVMELGYERVEGPNYIPTPESTCTVFMYDATAGTLYDSPTIVVTAYERGVYSFRISLN